VEGEAIGSKATRYTCYLKKGKRKACLVILSYFLFIVQATFYPGLCEPTSQGGLGFDYYVNLSVSEMWSSFLEDVPDHEWSMSKVSLFD
jgi:hypothetical protein